MSWSIGTTLNQSDGLTAGLEQLKTSDRENIGNAQCVKECDEQIDAAIDAIAQLLSNPSFDNAEEISVSLSGHANPEHKPSQGYANEFVSITISVKSYRLKKATG